MQHDAYKCQNLAFFLTSINRSKKFKFSEKKLIKNIHLDSIEEQEFFIFFKDFLFDQNKQIRKTFEALNRNHLISVSKKWYPKQTILSQN